MAITITSPTNKYIHAFNDSDTIFTVSTDNVSGSLIRCEVLEQPSNTAVSEQFAHIIDGSSTFNLRGVLTSYVSSFNNPITSGTLPAVGAMARITASESAKKVKLKFTEFELETEAASLTSDDIYVLKSAINEEGTRWHLTLPTNAAYFTYTYPDTTTTILKRMAFPNQIIPITTMGVVADNGSTLQFTTNEVVNGVAGSTTYYTAFENVIGINLHVYRNNSAKFKRLRMGLNFSLSWYDQPTGLDIHTTPEPCRAKTLYFLNQRGGWEWFNFIDFEVNQTSKKDEYEIYNNSFMGAKSYYTHVEDNNYEYRLYGRYINGTEGYYLRDIITSPIVLDELGNRVQVLTSRIKTDVEDLYNPEITIRYISTNVLNY